jgi:hypothetical protein
MSSADGQIPHFVRDDAKPCHPDEPGEEGSSLRQRGLRASIVLAGLLLILAGCYVPDKFKSEVRVGSDGSYAISFYGDLIWAPLYRDLQRGAVPADQIPVKIAEIERDLKRDPAFKKVESAGDGRFHVTYRREGRLQATDLVTFVRRNAIILQLKASPDGRVALDGSAMKPSEANEAATMGLTVEGEFRLITDAQVLSHNAGKVTLYQGYPVYIWKIQNAFSPPPHLVMQRSGAWPHPQKAEQ